MIPDAVLDETGLLHEEAKFDSVVPRLGGAGGDHPLDGIGADESVFVGLKTETTILEGDILLKAVH